MCQRPSHIGPRHGTDSVFQIAVVRDRYAQHVREVFMTRQGERHEQFPLIGKMPVDSTMGDPEIPREAAQRELLKPLLRDGIRRFSQERFSQITMVIGGFGFPRQTRLRRKFQTQLLILYSIASM